MRNILAAASVAGLMIGAPALAQAPDASTVLATVDGQEITLGQVVSATERMGEQAAAMPDDAVLENMLQQMVDQELLSNTVSKSAESDPKAVRIELENGRRGLLAAAAVQEMMAEPLPEADLQAAYDESIAALEPRQEFSAAHILVATEDEAKAVETRLEAGEDFATIAQELSLDPGSGANGGDLGWFGAGQMVPQFEAAVMAAEPGQVTDPVQTDFGWHLILVNESRVAPPPAFEDVRGDIETAMRQDQIRGALEELRAAADIQIKEVDLPDGAIRDTSIIRE